MATTLKKQNIKYTPTRMINVTCPFCGGKSNKIFERFGPQNFYTYVKCDNCSLVYLNPRPEYDRSFVETAYEDYAEDNAFYQSGELNNQDKTALEHNNFIIQQIESKLGFKGRLLEIGCATGLFLQASKNNGWKDIIGIDVSNKMIEFIKNRLGINAIVANYEDYIFEDNKKLDVIYCSHVIEHIPFPNKWMEKIKRDLSEDGLLVINVPNQISLDRVIKRFINKYLIDLRKWEGWRTPDHMYEPSVTSMKYLFQKHNFDLLDTFTYSKNEHLGQTIVDRIFHHYLKLGSKIRFFVKNKNTRRT